MQQAYEGHFVRLLYPLTRVLRGPRMKVLAKSGSVYIRVSGLNGAPLMNLSRVTPYSLGLYEFCLITCKLLHWIKFYEFPVCT